MGSSLKTWMSSVVTAATTHLQTLLGGGTTVHGMSGWGADAKDLAASQAPGTATTVSRGDHVHPIPYGVTGFGASAQSLAASQAPGTATTVSRGDHVHPIPYGVTGFGSSAAALAGSQAPGTATTVSRGDHVHPYPTLANLGAAAVGGSLSQAFNASGLTLAPTGYIDTTGYTSKLQLNNDFNIFTDAICYVRNSVYGAAPIICGWVTCTALRTTSYAGIGHSTYSGKVIPWDQAVTLQCATFYANGEEGTGYARCELGVVVYTSATARSDMRLKRNVRAMTQDSGLTRLRALAAGAGLIHFNFDDDAADEPERTGLSAQAVAQLVPEASRVLAPPLQLDGSVAPVAPGSAPLLGWEVGAMIALLVDAVATLDARLTALEAPGRGRP